MENIEEIVFEHDRKIAGHDEQIKTLFEQHKEIRELAKSNNNLALAIEKLVEQFKGVDKRICAIEDEKKYRLNIIWACLTTGIIGACISFIMAKVLG